MALFARLPVAATAPAGLPYPPSTPLLPDVALASTTKPSIVAQLAWTRDVHKADKADDIAGFLVLKATETVARDVPLLSRVWSSKDAA